MPASTEIPADSDSFSAALTRHDLALSKPQQARLERYAEALWAWNEKLNLTRHTNFEKFVGRDVADAVRLTELLEQGERVLDVGTGGGMPGSLLAILRPDLKVELCDSVAKKAKAVQGILKQVELPLIVHAANAQTVLAQQTYNTLVARAVAPLPKLLTWFQPLWERFHRLLVFKGPSWVEERTTARESGLLKNLELRKRQSYLIPGANEESVILEIWPKKPGASTAE